MIKKLLSVALFPILVASCMSNSSNITLPKTLNASLNISDKKINKCEDDNITVKISYAVDGDTLVYYCDWKSYKIRMLGIDTPETKHPSKPVQCFWKEASNKMKKLVEDKKVILKINKSSWNKDKYWRLLRYVYLWNKDIWATMISEGYAFSYKRFPHSKLNSYNLLEVSAKKEMAWLWDGTRCDY